MSAFDALLDPLDEILRTMKATHKDIQGAYRAGVLFLAFSGVMGLVQVLAAMRMADVQAQLAQVVESQRQLQQTTSLVAAKQTESDKQAASQAQITLEPGVTPEGVPTAIVVVKASQIAGVDAGLSALLPLAPAAVSARPRGSPAPAALRPPSVEFQ